MKGRLRQRQYWEVDIFWDKTAQSHTPKLHCMSCPPFPEQWEAVAGRDRCLAVWFCLQQWPLRGTLHFSGPYPREAHDRLLSMVPGLARPQWKEWRVSLGGRSSCPSFLVIAQHTVKVKGRQGGLKRAGEGLAEHRRAPGECASI